MCRDLKYWVLAVDNDFTCVFDTCEHALKYVGANLGTPEIEYVEKFLKSQKKNLGKNFSAEIFPEAYKSL